MGTSYRSAIFYENENQKRIAEAYIAQLNAAHVFARPIATQVTPLKAFYRGEDYHQDYALHNPGNPYILVCDRPKIEALKKEYPESISGVRRQGVRETRLTHNPESPAGPFKRRCRSETHSDNSKLDIRLRSRSPAAARISALYISNQWRWGIHGELVCIRRHFEVAVEHLVICQFPAGAGGHAAHARNQAGFHPTLHLVVGLIISNGIHQIIPFILIRVLLLRLHLGFPKHVGGQVLACIQA